MTSVLDNETDVVVFGKVNRGNDIVAGRDIDCVADKVAQQTRPRLRGEGVATLVGKVGLHDRGRRLETIP